MKTHKSVAKDISTIAVFVCVLLASQLALSAINGVELVTALLAGFAFSMSAKKGFAVVNIFVIIRSTIFGFFPSVMILYFFYYNIFVLTFWAIGKKSNHELSKKSFAVSLIAVIALVAIFTALDDIITPIFYSLDWNTTKAYWIMSLTSVIPQEICAILTMIFLFPIIVKVLGTLNFRPQGSMKYENRTL